jgi:hypothetical protein
MLNNKEKNLFNHFNSYFTRKLIIAKNIVRRLSVSVPTCFWWLAEMDAVRVFLKPDQTESSQNLSEAKEYIEKISHHWDWFAFFWN